MAFNPAAATAAYIDALGPEALAKAADYTRGSEWLLLWGVVVSAVVTFVFVRLGILDRLAAKLERRGWATRTLLLCSAFLLLSALLTVAGVAAIFLALGKDPVEGLSVFFLNPLRDGYALRRLAVERDMDIAWFAAQASLPEVFSYPSRRRTTG